MNNKTACLLSCSDHYGHRLHIVDAFLREQGFAAVCGIDEAGCGPLAGPVYAAAVILDPNDPIEGLNDSKKLTEKKREALFPEIQKRARAWAIASASPAEIDEINEKLRQLCDISGNAVYTLDALKENRIPILFIHGKADHYVPHEMTLQNYEACTSEKRLVLVEGAGHGTSYLQDKPLVEKELADFFRKYNP